MTLAREIKPGYGRLAAFGVQAEKTDFTDEVKLGALRELGDDLDIDVVEQDRIIRNVRAGRPDPWHH